MEKVFIGVPVRDTKGYSIEKYLESVKALEWDNIEFVMIDNSDTDILTKIIETKLVDKKIDVVSMADKEMKSEVILLPDMMGRESEARLALSREYFREMFLKSDAVYWLSWECDIILPPDALKVLIGILQTNQVDIVNCYYPDRDEKFKSVSGIGCSLFTRKCLETVSFMDNGAYGYCDSLIPNCYYGGDSWFMRQLERAKFKMLDLHNILEIQHLGDLD